ncbi:hypothetical protein E2C01_057236 [Portunus trituberculatus]|uniref:Uncharacterized protein n=1 Tax=Portunus trituberculatus TaxID=210409 RepID=A0A5B7GW91_PORTR|nr:hypothetical protein [Portunus trituberculatus]
MEHKDVFAAALKVGDWLVASKQRQAQVATRSMAVSALAESVDKHWEEVSGIAAVSPSTLLSPAQESSVSKTTPVPTPSTASTATHSDSDSSAPRVTSTATQSANDSFSTTTVNGENRDRDVSYSDSSQQKGTQPHPSHLQRPISAIPPPQFGPCHYLAHSFLSLVSGLIARAGSGPLLISTNSRPRTLTTISNSQASLTTIPHHSSACLPQSPIKGRLKQRPLSPDEPCRLIPQLCATTQFRHSCGDRDMAKQ